MSYLRAWVLSNSLFIKMTVNLFLWWHFEISSDLLFSSSSGLELIIISFYRAKVASLRDVAVRSYSAADSPFNIKVFVAVA